MQRIIACLALAIAFVVTAPAGVLASNMTQVYAVHGVPGAMGFPVDIQVTDLSGPTPLCLSELQGVTFGNIIGPLSLPNPGMYRVDIYAANAVMPCTGDVVLTKDVQLTNGMGSASIVAHLMEDGTPTISCFENNVTPTGRGMARIIAHHTAQAPPVDIVLSRGSTRARGNRPRAVVQDAPNGEQAMVGTRPGNSNVYLALDETDPSTIVLGPIQARFAPFTAYLVYAIGVPGESLTLAIKEVGGLR